MMVRERKSKIIHIDKIHEYVDNMPTKKEKKISQNEEKKSDSSTKRLSDFQIKTPVKAISNDLLHLKSENYKPQVVIHKREEIQKKDDRINEIDLGQRVLKKQNKPIITDSALTKNKLFLEESIYEVEKVELQEEENRNIKTIDKDKELPEWIPVERKTIDEKNSNSSNERSAVMFHPKSTLVGENHTLESSTAHEKENRINAEKPIKFKIFRTMMHQQKRSEKQKKGKEELKRIKLEKKQAKEKKREVKRLAKKHNLKLHLKLLKFQKKT